MQPLNIFWVVGASQGVLLCLFLILKKDRIKNLPLTIFIFLTSIELLFQYIYAERIIFEYPHLLYLSEPFSMLSGVLIYFYTRNILENDFIFTKKDLFFFLPFITYVIYYFPAYNQTAEDKIADIMLFYNSGITWYENLYEWIAEVIISIPFLYFTIKQLNKYHLNFKNNFSDLSKINYTVVRNLIIVYIFLYSTEAITIVMAYLQLEIVIILNSIIYFLLIIIVYIVGYDAIVRKPNESIKYIYIKEEKQEAPDVIIPPDLDASEKMSAARKYEKNMLSEEKVKMIKAKIEQCIITQKPHRNPDIRLNDLSTLIDEHANNVSQVLNDIFERNFYDFINFHRIEEAKQLLVSPEFKNYTITAIGFEVGFNSKSAFYTAFKKFTDNTPTQYQKNISTE